MAVFAIFVHFSGNNARIFMEKRKSSIISWLASMSEYKKGLLGPGGGMHSTKGHSVLLSARQLGTMVWKEKEQK